MVSASAHRIHQSGLGVGHEHEDVSVQTELVDPAVELRGDINARAEDRERAGGSDLINPLIPFSDHLSPHPYSSPLYRVLMA